MILVHVDHAYRTTAEPSTLEALESFIVTYTLTMRRAQSTRHVTRASVPTIGTNDLGVLKEVPEESKEVALRRQLLEKSKENDKVYISFTFITLTPIWHPSSLSSSKIKYGHSRRSSRCAHRSKLSRNYERNTVTLSSFYKERSARMNVL